MTKRQQPRLLWYTHAQSVGYVLRTLNSPEFFFSGQLTHLLEMSIGLMYFMNPVRSILSCFAQNS